MYLDLGLRTRTWTVTLKRRKMWYIYLTLILYFQTSLFPGKPYTSFVLSTLYIHILHLGVMFGEHHLLIQLVLHQPHLHSGQSGSKCLAELSH